MLIKPWSAIEVLCSGASHFFLQDFQRSSGHLAHGPFGIAVNPASDGGFESRRAGRAGAAGTESVIFALAFLVAVPGPVNEDTGAVERTANLCHRLARNLQVYDGAAELFGGRGWRHGC